MVGDRENQPVEQRRFGTHESLTLIFLTFGVLVPVVGVLAGLVGLWTSRFWTRRHKTVATALIALAIPVFLLLSSLLFPGMFAPWEVLILDVLIGPVVGALYLLPTASARQPRPATGTDETV